MKTQENGLSGKTFKKEELDEALRHAFDIFDRCACVFMIAGESLKDIIEKNQLETPQIDLAIEKKNLAESTRNMLKTLATLQDLNLHMQNYHETKEGFEWEYMGVPIKARVVNRKYKFFASPDTMWYNYDIYFVPNPVKDYLKARYIVQ